MKNIKIYYLFPSYKVEAPIILMLNCLMFQEHKCQYERQPPGEGDPGQPGQDRAAQIHQHRQPRQVRRDSLPPRGPDVQCSN